MKKFLLIWAVLVLAVPAMAGVTITATPDGNTGNVDLVVDFTGTIPRAFALDVNVTPDVNITAVTPGITGESTAGAPGWGIFPASFNREIDADDPNWADANYTPVADACDLPGDTLGGLNTSGVTLELGSLYVGDGNKPTSGETIATVTVDGSCTLCIARNVGRGKVVLEDGNEPSPFTADCVAVTVEPPGCACLGDVSSIAAAGVPDGNVSMTDASYVTDLVNAHGTGRPKMISSTDTEHFLLCADVSSIAAAGVPDANVSMTDASYITDLVNAHGTGRPKMIRCPHPY